MQHGGKYLNEGTYGCAFTPSFPCGGDDNMRMMPGYVPPPALRDAKGRAKKPKEVSKVFSNVDELEQEWQQAKRIAKIDPHQRYFVYATSRCTVPREKVTDKKEARQCTLLHKNTARHAPVPAAAARIAMLKMPFGGEPLDRYVQKHTPTVREVLRIMLPVFEGVQRLVRCRFAHHDLKGNNMLVQADQEGLMQAKVIDFGLSMPTADLISPSKNFYLQSDYWLHPPEYRTLVHAYMHGDISAGDAAALLSKDLHMLDTQISRHDKHTLAGLVIPVFFTYEEYADASAAWRRQVAVHARRGPDATVAFIQKHAATRVDVYSLGITLMYLSQFMDMKKSDDAAKKGLIQLVRHMVHPDPRQRWSASAVLKFVQALIPTHHS